MKLKKIIVSVSALALMLGSASNAFACTALYVGGELQQEIFADFDAIAAADTTQAKQAAATEASKAMAEKVHAKTLALYECLMGKK